MNRIAPAARLLLLAGLTAALVLNWLPLVRGLLDGDSYQWGLMLPGYSISGAGLAGDYGWLVGWAGLGVGMLFLGWRWPGALFKVLSVLWTGAMFADAARMLAAGQGVDFEGATLGMALSFELIAAAVYGLLLVLALIWAVFGRAPHPVRWGLANTVILAAAVAMLPLQYVLLRTGQGQEARDVIGVLMTLGQWLLISLSFAPWGSRTSYRPAV